MHLRSLGFYHCHPYMSYLKKNNIDANLKQPQWFLYWSVPPGAGWGIVAFDFFILLVTDICLSPKSSQSWWKKKSKIVLTLTSRFVAINAHQCDKCLPFDELYSKIVQFSKIVWSMGYLPWFKTWKKKLKVGYQSLVEKLHTIQFWLSKEGKQ